MAWDRGLKVADDVRAAVVGCEVVITCVTDGSSLIDIVDQPRGLFETLGSGAVVIDMTSAEPWIGQRIAERLASRKVPFLDAPVSGGVPAAESGRLNFMVGGAREVLDRVRGVLAPLGSPIVHVGEVGAGHAMKALNMLSMAANMLALAELCAAGERQGVRASDLVSALGDGPGWSYMARVHFPRYVLSRTYNSGFTYDLMRKDVGIGVSLARRHGAHLPMCEITGYLYEAASSALGLAGRDNTLVTKLMFQPRRGPTAQLPGSPSIVDLIDVLRLTHAAIAIEIIVLGARCGFTAALVAEVLCAGSGGSASLHEIALGGSPDAVAGRASNVVTQLIEHDVPMPLIGTAREIWRLARRHCETEGADAFKAMEQWVRFGEQHLDSADAVTGQLSTGRTA
jgi:3-hydroxyisobutyrate dehydrogenase-like beta-hydroxyacid dehydrogenase